MGIREDQHIGLNDRGLDFLRQNAEHDHFETFKNGEKISERHAPRVVDGKYRVNRMFDYMQDYDCAPNNRPNIPGYLLKDGTKVYEREQACPWSSGPCHFTALADEDGEWIKETLWTEKEIEEYL